MPDNQHHYRFETGPVIKVVVGGFAVAAVALAVVAPVTVSGIAVALLVLLAVSGGVGIVLERIDSSRRREQGSDDTRDESWGFQGRPGG